MVAWHHQLNGHGFGWTLGVGKTDAEAETPILWPSHAKI